MRIEFGTSTSQGKIRTSNEDSFAAEPGGPLFLVADGMGGHAAGEVASRIVAVTVAEVFAAAREGPLGLEAALLRAVQEANHRVFAAQQGAPELSGMGSTLTALAFDDTSYLIAHVGDSRAYLMRDGALRQLTQDHSLVWHLFQSGILRKDELSSHPQKNLITRSIGPHQDVEVDLERGEACPGDMFLLCSDGLTDVLTDDGIREIISAADRTPQQLGDALVSAANQGGGPDNITVIVVRLHPDP